MSKKNNNNKYIDLRKQFNSFTYKTYEYKIKDDGLHMQFDFIIDDFIQFNPSLVILNNIDVNFSTVSTSLISQIVFNIGMVELISYWKAICPKDVYVLPYNLDENQIDFWKKIYFNGLGEFFYLNEIKTDIDSFMNLIPNSKARHLSPENMDLKPAAVIPVGGGKDSVVSIEILKGSGDNVTMIMNPRGASTDTASIGGFENSTIIVKRILDVKLLDLNAKGFLNGHTPFSALLAFVSVLVAAVSHRKYIALSNESSANEATVPGTNVNHQYSKSLEFETDFRNYIEQYISPDIKYFSLLRPLSELQIASIFANNKKYFKHFRSCNVGSKTNSWCGKCSKCLFTFIILSPFIKPEILIDVFGSNLLDDESHRLYFNELTGTSDVKPFECVGTVDEVNAALCMAVKMYDKDNLPLLLKEYADANLGSLCSEINKEQLLNTIENDHYLEDDFLEMVQNKLENK